MRKKIVAGNWKMNGNYEHITLLLTEIKTRLSATLMQSTVVFPPTIYIPLVRQLLQDTSIRWGAQNVYCCDQGAFTGETSALMLQDYACSYVLVGHSERRTLFFENEKIIAEKFHQIKERGMIPILCVGETIQEREQGLTQDILSRQILSIAKENNACFDNCVIAYEPVWAIGTGKTPLPEEVQAVHVFIRSLIAEWNKNDAQAIPLLYGGSVNERNAGLFFALPDVDGGLIGGASLNASQFVEIIQCIN